MSRQEVTQSLLILVSPTVATETNSCHSNGFRCEGWSLCCERASEVEVVRAERLYSSVSGACQSVAPHPSPAVLLSSICDVQEIPGKIYSSSVPIHPPPDAPTSVCALLLPLKMNFRECP